MEESTACAELPFQFSFSSHPRVLNVLGVQTTNNHRLTKGKYGRYYCPKQAVFVSVAKIMNKLVKQRVHTHYLSSSFSYLSDCMTGVEWYIGASLYLTAFACGHTVYRAGTD